MASSERGSLGLVETHSVDLFDEDELELESGVRFGPITVAYETYGTLSPERDNVILVCHALSGGAHAAGYLPGQKKPGWWDIMIGPGKAFDTNRYFVVCSNVLGSCYGTTGPSSIDPKTGRPYALRFPVVTIRDMVQVQARLLDYLGIRRVLCVTGGSMGGMQALQWAVSYPERVRSVIAIATTHRHSAQQIAFNEVARQAIMADPAWNGGDYYGTPGPRLGLAVARMIGHITYLSDVSMERKFGRRLRNRERYGYDFSLDFEVESYLRYQGQSFVERFDANSLLYLTKALDYFDLSQNHGSLTRAFAGSPSLYLFITFSSDWLYPPHQLKEVAQAIRRGGGDASYCEINSDYGHDAFLLEYAAQEPLIRSFLDRVQNTTVAGDTGEGI
ncbi:MAG: homoserine O-acetyltransferase [Candidatus Sumerlaea chitinivorans]|nr:homoserine O-acetyltransferase [Candidatus Sumerlaea chitinivorans]